MAYLDALGWCMRTLVTLILLISAIVQVRTLDAFNVVLTNYRLLPQWALVPAQYGFPALETFVAVALLIAPQRGTLAAASLLLAFATAMAINLMRGRRDIECGCHSAGVKQRLRWTLVLRNCFLALALVLTIGASEQPNSPVALLGAVAGTCLYLLYVAMNSLWALGRLPRRRRIRVLGGGA